MKREQSTFRYTIKSYTKLFKVVFNFLQNTKHKRKERINFYLLEIKLQNFHYKISRNFKEYCDVYVFY